MKNISVWVLVLLGLSACGGSYSPPPSNDPPPTGGIGRTGLAIGPISNFGSVVVNGVRYDTSSASFTVNDGPGSQADLSVGQIVIVAGTFDNSAGSGVANQVTFDDNVTGPIDSIDAGGASFVALGQMVLVGAETSFDDSISPASLDGLSVGDVVEVSGLIDSDGSIVATRIERKAAGSQFEVHGIVASLDTTAMTFMIGSLVVDYSSAMLEDFPAGVIVDGDFVEAKGSVFGGFGELLATEVELENAEFDADDDGTHVEIEGFITRFDSPQDFAVSGIDVIADNGTVIEGGTAADLGLNVKVEVEGELNGSGVLLAAKIDIRQANDIRVTALVDSVDAMNNSLVMLGIPVDVDELTRLEDKSNADVDPLNVSDISAGDYLEVRGDERPAGGGRVRAALLEREDVDNETELRGFVESISQPSFSILGVSIDTNASTVFRDENEAIITAAEFFSSVAQDSQVKAKGTEISAMAILADEVEFED